MAREALPARAAHRRVAHAAGELDRHLEPYGDVPAVQELRRLGASA